MIDDRVDLRYFFRMRNKPIRRVIDYPSARRSLLFARWRSNSDTLCARDALETIHSRQRVNDLQVRHHQNRIVRIGPRF